MPTTGELPTRRIEPRDEPEATRNLILQAAIVAASVHGVARVSMSDVARTAGLSRPTLYRYFPSKHDLLAAALLTETTTLVSRVIEAVATIDDPAEAIETGVLVALRLTREHPLLDRTVRTEPEVLVPVLVAESDPGTPNVLGMVRAVVQSLLAAKLPALDTVTCRRLADLLARLLLSYAVNPPDDPPEVVACSLAAMVTVGVLNTAIATP
jgi:AcrR family transcriptional regulator